MKDLILNQSRNIIPPMANNVIETLTDIAKNKSEELESWFDKRSEQTAPFFYNSVDLRNSGYKLAPVDTNLFPAGFNNLNQREFENAKIMAKEFFAKFHPNVKNVLIIAEDHTRNLYYLENLHYLNEIIKANGLNVVLTNLSTCESGEKNILESTSGKEINLIPVKKEGGKIIAENDFAADFVLVNNDMTEGAPDLLKDVDIIVSPPLGFGWYKRRKTSHFDSYNQLAREFCHDFNIDPWLVTTYFRHCGVVNFKDRKGIECVALAVDKTISLIQKKYHEYGITDKPYVFVKSDKGTYGMGIMTASSGDEMYEMGKKIRNKMNTIKGGVQNSEVIIQEGVPTIDKVNGNPAEPMIYMIGGRHAGCIYRTNTQKDSYDNLNSKGMEFVSIENHVEDKKICDGVGIISRLASYAAARECYEISYSI